MPLRDALGILTSFSLFLSFFGRRLFLPFYNRTVESDRKVVGERDGEGLGNNLGLDLNLCPQVYGMTSAHRAPTPS